MGSSLIVEGIKVDADILESYFVCDLNTCRGACCTLKSEVGAPVEPAETDRIQNALSEILPFMSDEGRQDIAANGWVKTSGGKHFTPTLGGKACVYARFEKGIAACAMEAASTSATDATMMRVCMSVLLEAARDAGTR